MSKATDIVGYTYAADTYCTDVCVIGAMGPSAGRDLLSVGWKVADIGTRGELEDALTALSVARGVDRFTESSYDSGDFPKVIFSSQIDFPEYCATCGTELDT